MNLRKIVCDYIVKIVTMSAILIVTGKVEGWVIPIALRRILFFLYVVVPLAL